ncbi:MAG: hypothetical protein ACKOC5_12655 [Chloroflexota bacterium]
MKGRLLRLSALIEQRNQLDAEIAGLIDAPAQPAYLAEFIARVVFEIQPREGRDQRRIDGHFSNGRLAGRTVAVRWYPRQTDVLDIPAIWQPDYLLAFSGPCLDGDQNSRPWVIEAAYLFDTRALVHKLKRFGQAPGVAVPLNSETWRAAEIYPRAYSPLLRLTPEQGQLLALFAGEAVDERAAVSSPAGSRTRPAAPGVSARSG